MTSKNEKLAEIIERIEEETGEFSYLTARVESRRQKERSFDDLEMSLENTQKRVHDLCKKYVSVYESENND